MRWLGPLSAAALALGAAGSPRGARAGDGGAPPDAATIHVAVSKVKILGEADAAARAALHPDAIAAAVCDGIQKARRLACLTAADVASLGRLRALQGITGHCGGGNCAGTDSAITTPDDVVNVTVEVKGGGYVLHLAVIRPPAVDPVFHADTEASSPAAVTTAARDAAVKAGARVATQR